MPLESGTRLGPYEITAKLGEGGMGEVYRARDTALNREVAIKVMPEALAGDPDRLARFQREAESLAALNHPNIAQVYGLERSGAVPAIVMELVDGEDLSAHIARGPISTDDALPIARQIIDALEAAHERGIIHRDLKPANIKVRGDGTVKVLDFGLAKAMEADGARATVETANSPTLTARATQMGMIIGTAAYMSPEQARGRPVDKRTDVWAFGCVLYEMITGKKAFDGDDATEIISAVVKSDLDWDVLPATVPAHVRTVVDRCLIKERKQRIPDLSVVRYMLDATMTPSAEGGSAAGLPAPVVAKRKQREQVTWALGALALALVAATAAWLLKPAPAAPDAVGVQFEHVLPDGQSFSRTGRQIVALSPDGTRLVYAANEQLYLRDLGQLNAQPIPGTQLDPAQPVFSPDGLWIAFFENESGAGVIRRIPVGGGTSSPVVAAENPFGITWSLGFIVYGQSDGIYRVADIGGAPERLVANDAATGSQVGHPQLVDGGRHLLYSASDQTGRFLRGTIRLREITSGDDVELVADGTAGRLLPTGHLVFYRDGAVFAAALDLAGRSVGGAAPVIEGVSSAPGSQGSQYAVSDAGVVAYVSGGALAGGMGGLTTLMWFDRAGRSEPVGAPPLAYNYPRISPDGTRIATGTSGGDGNLFVWDIRRGINERVTSEDSADAYPVWTADGRHLFFSRGGGGPGVGRLLRRASDGTGVAESFWQDEDIRPLSLTQNDELLLYREGAGARAHRLFFRPLTGGEPRAVVADATIRAINGAVSPDGRWIAYASTESGDLEVFVRPFPDVEAGRTQVSSGGGTGPVWSRTGRELFYVAGNGADRQMTVVAVPDIPPNTNFKVGASQTLFPYPGGGLTGRMFDVSPDGQRFVVAVPGADGADSRSAITIITDWFTDVRKVR